MSILNWKNKVLGYTAQMGGGGSGGGGSTQTTSTSNTSNIPPYAQPYVETMLGATQKQLFNMDDSGNITGFSPYKAYGGTYDAQGNQTSYDPSKGIAGFSDMQKQAQQGVAGLRMPGQFQQGSQMVGAAGQGSLGLAGQMAGAGQNYANMATDPNAVKAYMNPYIEGALQPQLNQLAQQAGIQSAGQQGSATQAGAFGGSRSALANSLAQQNGLMAQQAALGQGYNQAFQQAQQAQQFGANLGLQGQQGALSAYGQAGQAGASLANIGAQELAAQQGIYNLQNQYGKEQQGMQQQILNQSMQDYANAQQYPLMQLGTMSNMLRGLPMQGSTTNQYVAAPNQVTQGIGMAGAGASIYNALGGGKKAGGVVGMAKGGIAGYNVGGEIKSKLYEMDPTDIQQYIKESASPAAKKIAEEVLRDKTGKAGGGIIAFSGGKTVGSVEPDKTKDTSFESLPSVTSGEGLGSDLSNFLFGSERRMSPESKVVTKDTYVDPRFTEANPEFVKAEAVRKSILAANPQAAAATSPAQAPGNASNTDVQFDPTAGKNPAVTNAKKPDAPAPAPAGNGGVGIKPNTGLAPNIGGIKFPTAPAEETAAQLAKGAEERVAAYGVNEGNQKAMAAAMAEKANAADEAKRITSLRMAEFFGAWGSTPGNTIIAGLNALKNKIPDFIGDIKEEAKIRKAINKDIAELDKLDRDEKNGIKKDYFKERSELADRALRKYGYDITSATQMYSADKQLEGIKIASASRENASSNKGGFKSVQDAENALDKHITEGNKIGSQYSTDKAVVKARKEAYDADKLDAKQKTQYEAALKTVTNFENREKELRDNVNFFKQNKGMNTGTTSSAGASSGVDLNNYWKK